MEMGIGNVASLDGLIRPSNVEVGGNDRPVAPSLLTIYRPVLAHKFLVISIL